MKIFFPGQFRSPSETLLWRRFCYPTFSEQKQKTTMIIGDFNVCPKRRPKNEVNSFLSRHKFSQLVTLPTHIDGGAFFSIITIKSFNGFKVVKYPPLNTYVLYLQESWTKPIFARPRKLRKMLKSRPTHPTTATMTLCVWASTSRYECHLLCSNTPANDIIFPQANVSA